MLVYLADGIHMVINWGRPVAAHNALETTASLQGQYNQYAAFATGPVALQVANDRIGEDATRLTYAPA
jgi:hypothetical protein